MSLPLKNEIEISFKLPAWAVGRHIYILAGAELLGKKECRIARGDKDHAISYLPLEIKPEKGRCNGCGSCCGSASLPPEILNDLLDRLLKVLGSGEIPNLTDGPCPFLTPSGCCLRGFIPFSCVKSVCSQFANCSEYLEVK